MPITFTRRDEECRMQTEYHLISHYQSAGVYFMRRTIQIVEGVLKALPAELNMMLTEWEAGLE